MFYIISLSVAAIMFVFTLIFFKSLRKRRLLAGQYIIHHSCWGIVLIILSLFLVPETIKLIVSAVGTGVYLSHIVEEVYFDKTSIWLAPFVFITKIR